MLVTFLMLNGKGRIQNTWCTVIGCSTSTSPGAGVKANRKQCSRALATHLVPAASPGASGKGDICGGWEAG